MMLLLVGCSVKDEFDGKVKTFDSNGKMDFSEVNVNETTYNDLIEMYGLADKYNYYDRIFDPNELPNLFYMTYGNDMCFRIRNNQILEMRLESEKVTYGNELYIGQDLDEALTFLAEPDEVVSDISLYWKKDVLYKNVTDRGDGDLGYYHDTRTNIRIWIEGDKLSAIYYISEFETTFDQEEKVIGESKLPQPYNYFGITGEGFEDDPDLRGKWSYVDQVFDLDEFVIGKRRSVMEFINLNFLSRGEIKDSYLVWSKGVVFSMYSPDRVTYTYEFKAIEENDYLVLEQKLENHSYFYIFEREVN